MATYNICCRLQSKLSRFQISVNDTAGYISNLHQEIGKRVDVKETDFDVLYAGSVLPPDCQISKFPLQNHSTLYVVPKFTSYSSQINEESPVNTAPNSEILWAMHAALLNRDYRKIVEQILTDPEAVENIIATSPGLDKDPSVLSMMAKPELLTVLVHPNNLDSLLKTHPSFAQTAITIATAVNEKGAKSGGGQNTGAESYSLDQMSDEDEDVPGPSRTQASSSGQNITASQLAAALQAAAGSSLPFDQGAPGVQNEAGPSSSGTAITSDFFQQAMLQAQNASTSDGASQQMRDMGNALQQLRDMGITDENVARQALAATNGNIQAAIDLIFGDGFM